MWSHLAEKLAADEGGTAGEWLTLMAGYRPWRSFPDGRRERFCIVDDLPHLRDKLDELAEWAHLRWWAGYISWDREKCEHVVRPEGWPSLGLPLVEVPPRRGDEEIVEALSEVHAVLQGFEDILLENEASIGSLLVLPEWLYQLARFGDQVEEEKLRLTKEYDHLTALAEHMEGHYRIANTSR